MRQFDASQPLRVAVLGTGFGSKVHIPALQRHPETTVQAVYHRQPDRAAAIAEQAGIPTAYSDLDQLLADPAIEAVTIASPPFLHYPMAWAALSAGKSVLLEKPTTLNVEEARALWKLASSQGLTVTLDFEYRFVPAWQYVAELLAEGAIGQPWLVKLDWLMSSRADASRPWNWYAQRSQGGGALGALGSHSFDYLAWLFGPARRLQARLFTAIQERPDATTGELKPVDSDDTDLIQLELAEGVPCQISLSSVCRQGRGHWLEVYGDRGTLILGSSNQKDYVHGFQVWFAAAGQDLKELTIPHRLAFRQEFADGRLAPFLRVVDHWLADLRQGQMTTPSLKEGLYSQLLIDLCWQSQRSGEWQTVPELSRFL